MNIVELAERVAYEAHSGQFRKDGVTPYIDHPAEVVKILRESYQVADETIAVGWLHDVVEDTDVTIEGLRCLGFPPSVTDAVKLLTKKPGESPEVYMEGVLSNDIAMIVKAADILANLTGNGAAPSAKATLRYRTSLMMMVGKSASTLGGFDDRVRERIAEYLSDMDAWRHDCEDRQQTLDSRNWFQRAFCRYSATLLYRPIPVPPRQPDRRVIERALELGLITEEDL